MRVAEIWAEIEAPYPPPSDVRDCGSSAGSLRRFRDWKIDFSVKSFSIA